MSIDAAAGGLATDPRIAVAVLIDDGTASASEIVAGALAGRRTRATLVGEPTFGKGTIQEWSQLPGDSGGFRLSVAKWLTPDKHWVDGEGLQPDVARHPDGRRASGPRSTASQLPPRTSRPTRSWLPPSSD